MAYAKPLPVPSELTKPFWEAIKRHELVVQRCSECGSYTHPPKVACPNCLSFKQEWVPVSGEGTVYSFNITHRAPAPAFEAEVPYVIALVDLKDAPGVRLVSNIIQIDPKEVKMGMPVKAIFEDVTDDFSLFKFVPRR